MTRILMSALCFLVVLSVIGFWISLPSAPPAHVAASRSRPPDRLLTDPFQARALKAQAATLAELERVGRPFSGPLETCWARDWLEGHVGSCGPGKPAVASSGAR